MIVSKFSLNGETEISDALIKILSNSSYFAKIPYKIPSFQKSLVIQSSKVGDYFNKFHLKFQFS